MGVKIAGSGGYVGGLVGLNEYGAVTNCYSTGMVSGEDCVGGLVGSNEAAWEGTGGVVAQCYSTCAVTGAYDVGGLVGFNGERWVGGTITRCYSTGRVAGNEYVGGLVGYNWRVVTQCYSTGAVTGSSYVGGLVGGNGGSVTECYSTGAVIGTGENVGGLVGHNHNGAVTHCFWDTQTSGQATSDGGTSKTTAEMQTGSTFLNGGWDFVGETANGTEDIWWILEGKDYPRLWWQYGRAFSPDPRDGAEDVSRLAILRWIRGGAEFWHDVYFADDEAGAANATTETQGIYRGPQAPEMPAYDPGTLQWGKTYYWRIDEVNPDDPAGLRKGKVWSFTTTDCIKSPGPPNGAVEVIQPIMSRSSSQSF